MKNNVVSINVVQINAYILPPQDDGFPFTLHVGGTLPPWGDMDPAEREQRKKTTACISNEVAHALRLVGVPMWLHGDEPPTGAAVNRSFWHETMRKIHVSPDAARILGLRPADPHRSVVGA